MNFTIRISAILFFGTIFTFCEAKPKDDPRILTMAKSCNADDADIQVVLQYKVPSTSTGKCLMLCFLKQLNMFDTSDKYDENLGLQAFKGYWAQYPTDVLQDVNAKAAKLAKEIDSKSGTCEYGYEIMKFINAEFINKSLLKSQSS